MSPTSSDQALPEGEKRVRAAYHGRMDPVLAVPVIAAAPTWTYWVGVPLAIAGVLLVVATVVGYLRKVEAPRYPRDSDA